MRRIRLFFGLIAFATIASAATPTSASEPPFAHTLANVMVEVVFTATQDYRDAFHEVALDVLFETPEGRTLKVPGFWAGGRTWKVRYASPALGLEQAKAQAPGVDRATKKLENSPAFACSWPGTARSPTQFTEGFRVNFRIRRKLAERKRRIQARLDKTRLDCACPVISASKIHYELADRTQAICAGGIGMIHQLVKRLGLDDAINQRLGIFKIYLPYSESDHVLNIAYNLLAGGTRLEHLELRRNDEVYLNALGALRIPDPTTAGDFCRRFEPQHVVALMEIFNRTRIKVWQQQPDSFFEEAIIDADGTMVET